MRFLFSFCSCVFEGLLSIGLEKAMAECVSVSVCVCVGKGQGSSLLCVALHVVGCCTPVLHMGSDKLGLVHLPRSCGHS